MACMAGSHRGAAGPLLLLVASVGLLSAPGHAPTTSQAEAAEPAIRLIRSTSGTRGLQQGSRYVIEDPRTAFAPSKDRQVIVYFEWEGPPGTHRCEGRWKDPTGKVVLVAPIEYRADSRRFGIYWTLAIPETAARGLWALEAVVDGQPAGTHTFEINESAPSVPARRALAPSEIYRRALAAVATIERVGPDNQIIGQASAVAITGDDVLTSFEAIEGASVLRLLTQDGRRLATRDVAERNRRQDWALLEFAGHGLTPLPRAASGSLVVGDRCFVLDRIENGSRVIAEASVVGMDQPSGRRFLLNSIHAAGSPVLDEQGEIEGLIVAGGPEASLGPAFLGRGAAPLLGGSTVLPMDLVPPSPTARAISLSQLVATGELLRPLSPDQRHIASGVFASRVDRGGAVPMPRDQKWVFSRRDGQASVFIQWNPQEKRDVLLKFELYDADGRPLGHSDAKKVKLRPGELVFSTWMFGIENLAPAIYRVDLLLDQAPAWRGYLRVTE